MSRAADLLREETKRRAQTTWRGKLSKVGLWFKAADWLEENVSEETSDWPTVEEMAYALLRDATEGNGHPRREPREEIPKQIQDLWLKRAKRLQIFIDRRDK